MDPLTQLLTVLLPVLGTVLPGSIQNQSKLQQQTSQRQLSASDFANNPNAFLARLGALMGTSGASPSAAGGGIGGVQGALQAAIDKFTQGNSQNLTNNTWQAVQPKLAASGLGQAPGIANEEMSTALAPFQLDEQKLGATEGAGAVQSALQTEETNLQYPFQIGSGAAGSFPSFSAL